MKRITKLLKRNFFLFSPKKMHQAIYIFMVVSLGLFTGACSASTDPEVPPANQDYTPHQEEEIPRDGYSYLALGDSYTIGESVEPRERFPEQLVRKLNAESIEVGGPVIVAQTGWTTQDLQRGINNRNLARRYDMVTLLIGVNNQYQGRSATEYHEEFTTLLKKAIDFAGTEKRVIVISIPDYGVTPYGKNLNSEKIAEEIDLFNQINLEETRQAGAHYVDITPISRRADDDPDLVAQDGLHPSGDMYKLWVSEILPVAINILRNGG